MHALKRTRELFAEKKWIFERQRSGALERMVKTSEEMK